MPSAYMIRCRLAGPVLVNHRMILASSWTSVTIFMHLALQSPNTYFKVSFSSISKDVQQPWTWKAAEIVIEEEEEVSATSLRPLSSPK